MPFVPNGYLTLPAAIDRVVELRQGVDGSPLLTEDERATLRNWQDWRDQLSRPQPKPVTPVPKAGDRGLFVARTPGEQYPHRLVEAKPRRPDVNLEEIKDLLEKEPPFKEQQRAAGQVLRQLLYAGRVPSEMITGEGSRIETPQYIWGGGQWHEALSLNKITFRPSILSVTGFPIILLVALEAAFNPDGTVKEEPRPEIKQEVEPHESLIADPGGRGEATDATSDCLSRREQGKQETRAMYRRWYDRSKEIKADKKSRRPIEIARLVAKKEKKAGHSKAGEETIKRRLNEHYSGWAD